MKHLLIFSSILIFLYSCGPQEKTVIFSEHSKDTKLIIQNESKLDKEIQKMVNNMSLDELTAQMIISYPDKDIIEMGVGGVILFDHHIKKEKSTRKLIINYNKWSSVPLLVMIDQEGGRVNRLKNLAPYNKMPCAADMAQWKNSKIFSYNNKMADFLNKLNINMVLAPTLDVSTKGSLMYRSKRSFSTKHDIVKEKGEAFAHGLYANNVLTIGKHFPGYGDAIKNSDVSVVTSDITRKKLKQYIHIFQSVSKYLDGIMMSSIIYKTISDKPAVYSKEIVKEARKILPYGLIISDDIQAKSIRDYLRNHLKKNDIIIEKEQEIKSTKSPYCWSFKISELKYLVDMAFDADVTLILTLDPLKAIFIKHFLKERALQNISNMKKLRYNVYLILRKKAKVYPEYFQEKKQITLDSHKNNDS